MQVRCLTAEAPGKSKWSRNNVSQHIAALDWFLPLQAPPPRKSLLPPALQSSKPHSRGRHAHTGRDHGKQEDMSHACKPQSPFLVNSRAATPNHHLPQASRYSPFPTFWSFSRELSYLQWGSATHCGSCASPVVPERRTVRIVTSGRCDSIYSGVCPTPLQCGSD